MMNAGYEPADSDDKPGPDVSAFPWPAEGTSKSSARQMRPQRTRRSWESRTRQATSGPLDKVMAAGAWAKPGRISEIAVPDYPMTALPPVPARSPAPPAARPAAAPAPATHHARQTVTHPRLKDAQLVLLTTTGAKTGQPRTTPLAYFSDGPGRIILWASALAAPMHPAWYRNLAANPHVTIELGTDAGAVGSFDATAATAAGAERDRLFAVLAAHRPEIAAHQDQTTREIPLVIVPLPAVRTTTIARNRPERGSGKRRTGLRPR